MLSFNAFSQTVTAVDSLSYIVLQENVAKQVAAELIEKDLLVDQSRILRDSIGILKEINDEQSSIIVAYEQQKTLDNLKLQDYQQQLQDNIVLQERLSQQVKTNRAWAIGMGCTAAIAITATVLVLVLGGK